MDEQQEDKNIVRIVRVPDIARQLDCLIIHLFTELDTCMP